MEPSVRLDWSRLFTATLLGGVLAAVLNAVLFFAARALGLLTDMVLPGADRPLTLVPVLVASFVPALVAALLLAALIRFTLRPVRIFRLFALTFLLVSLFPPATIPYAPLGMVLVLVAMHVVAFACIVGVLTTRGVRA